jgi:hypothetical protein
MRVARWIIALVLCGLALSTINLMGCDDREQQRKLQEDQANFQRTVESIQNENDDKLQDAQMEGQRLKHGERAACGWLRQQHFAYVGPKTRSWQEACDALYPTRTAKKN